MKSFKTYISEITLDLAKTRKEFDADYMGAPIFPLSKPNEIEGYLSHQKVSTFTHNNQTYHLYRSITRVDDRISTDEQTYTHTPNFRIGHQDSSGNIHEIAAIGTGRMDGTWYREGEGNDHLVQNQLGRSGKSLLQIRGSDIDPAHSNSKGLMARAYREIAETEKSDLIADVDQTRGSQSIWANLSRTGRVNAVHASGEFKPFSYNPKNPDHIEKVYSGDDDALLHFSHD